MNMTHGFDTYRKCKNLQQLYHDIYSIKSTLESVQTALFSCSEYFASTSLTPDSLITSISTLLKQRIQEHISIHKTKRAVHALITQHIYDLTYSHKSSSLGFFIEHLHQFCDSLEQTKSQLTSRRSLLQGMR